MPSSFYHHSPPLAYETSAFELSADYPTDSVPWTTEILEQTITERASFEKSRHEIDVHYYRIGHTLAFPLPVSRRSLAAELPAGISTIVYPWQIWLAWELEERWNILHAAWRHQGDDDAGALLQRELAALVGWDHFHETRDEVGLVTAHIAGVLSMALTNEFGWDSDLLLSTKAAADALLARDVTPWLAQQWPEGEPLTPRRIHNIPVIALTRAAQLARVRGHPLTGPLDAQAIVVLQTWASYRTGPEFHTEGTAYDGYMMDSMTGWLAHLPQREALLKETATAFRNLADAWIQLTLPGRFDLQAPLGDTEPQMPYWTSPLLRLAQWYDWSDALNLLAKIPRGRLPAATIAEALDEFSHSSPASTIPAPAVNEHPHALTFRSGETSRDFLVVVGAPRSPLGHLHHDSGQVILGWRSRFWVTDPGYQQYREGAERDYSIGPAAHNPPVINGIAQSAHLAVVMASSADQSPYHHLGVDLSRCYAGLPESAVVKRDLWIVDDKEPLVVVRDQFRELGLNANIQTHWLGGDHLAWAFVDGWARLSNGTEAFWLGTTDEGIGPAQLIRHEGTRGPLTLAHAATLAKGHGERCWVLWGDAAGGWQPPELTIQAGSLKVTLPNAVSDAHSFKI